MIEIKPFYTCKYDKAFKEIMMKEENFNILKKVLETILKVMIQEIKLQPLNLNTGNIHITRKRSRFISDNRTRKNRSRSEYLL